MGLLILIWRTSRVLTFDGASREERAGVSMGQKGAISKVLRFFGENHDE